MSAKVTTVTTVEEFTRLCEAPLLVIDFNATWCGPCKVIAPHFEKLPGQFPGVKFASIDIDSAREIATQYSITAVPTFLFLAKGKEIARVRGANLQELTKTVNELSSKVLKSDEPGESSQSAATGESSSGSSNTSTATESYRKLIPKGFDTVNDVVEIKSLEVLNATAPKNPENVVSSLRSTFSTEVVSNAVVETPNLKSDTDAQLLFYVPFMNNIKLHTILIQTCKPEEDEVQRPERIRVWINQPSILSFDDTESMPPTHDERLEFSSEDAWTSVKLRYVRFQRVSSIVMLIEGEDEDVSTGVNKIILIGERGEKLEMGKLEKPEM
ncbi:PITH domain-containing protein [Dipodascopsis uninucleata]